MTTELCQCGSRIDTESDVFTTESMVFDGVEFICEICMEKEDGTTK